MKKIVITGANGFIGKYLTELLEQHKFEVKKLQRANNYHRNDSAIFYWKLGDKLPAEILSSDIFIHCAHDNSPTSLKKSFTENINYLGLKKILSQIRKKPKYEFYFLSSQTAQKNTKSYYGELKYHMEQLLDHKSDNQTEIIIRPGMVYGKNSHITQLIKKISKFKIVPFFSSKKNIQPIDLSDLCACIYKIIQKKQKQHYYNLASSEPINFKKYVKFICKDNSLSTPIFFYIPYRFIIIFAYLLDLLKISKFSISERVYGLLLLKKLDTNKSLQSLDYKLDKRFL